MGCQGVSTLSVLRTARRLIIVLDDWKMVGLSPLSVLEHGKDAHFPRWQVGAVVKLRLPGEEREGHPKMFER